MAGRAASFVVPGAGGVPVVPDEYLPPSRAACGLHQPPPLFGPLVVERPLVASYRAISQLAMRFSLLAGSENPSVVSAA